MWLHLDDVGPVRFHTPGAGLSLEIDQPHGPYDMDEYGHTTVEDDLPDFPMTRYVSERILSIREIRYRHENRDFAIGITLQFTSGSIRVLNLADEIVLAQDHHLGTVEVDRHVAMTPADADASP